MLNQIKALLSDAQWRQKIKEAANMVEAIELIKTAGIEKGYQFSSDSLSQLIQSEMEPLSEVDLLAVSGGMRSPVTVFGSCPETNCCV